MADEATATTPTETPAEPVEGQVPATPANDTTKQPANDNSQPQAPTEAEFLGWVEKYGPDKALQIVAKKLNMAVDGTTIGTADAIEFRRSQREWKKQTEAREKKIAEEWGQKIKESEAEIELGRALKKAKASGDYDGVAKALGEENWEALQGDFIKRLADPSHQRLVELERREQEREKQAQQQREQYERQQQETQRQAAIQGYKQKMSLDMQNSQDATVKELAQFGDVVEMLYAVQNEHFDPRGNGGRGSTVTLEQAMDLPLPNGRGTPRAILRSWHDALNKAFGGAEPPPAAKEAPKAKGKTSPAAPVSPPQNRTFKEDEWLERGARELQDAIRREDELKRAERLKGNSQASQ